MTQSGLLSVEQILDVGRKLMELRPSNEVLNAVLDTAMDTMHAEIGLILFRDPQGKWIPQAEKYVGEIPQEMKISTSLLEEAQEKAQPVITESAIEDPRFSGKSSIILQGIQAAVVIPLIGKSRIAGAIYLVSKSDRTQFHRDNLGPLSALAAFATLAIENSRQYESVKRNAASSQKSHSIIGSANVMQELFAMLDRVADSNLPVLILGESGTGKELVAREIHHKSDRRDKPFLALYCGNVSPQLFESELFGHKRGAFTGANVDKQGLVDAAKGGTLFLDEVADIPSDVQNKLLRFLQESEYRAVGDTVTKKSDVRIITATNKDLKREADEGRFRGDLYFRLFILPVHTPPLRERLSDIPFLVRHFLEKYGKEKDIRAIAPVALRKLMSYNWPGNVRELENTIARAMVVTQNNIIEPQDIILHEEIVDETHDLSWRAAEKRHILRVLQNCSNNKKKAAEILGVSRRHIHNRLNEWGMGTGKEDEE